jgi:hypothetical protein
MPVKRASALSQYGTRKIVERANDHAYTYAGFIRAAVREVGQSYSRVATWLTRERIPAQRNGRWTAQGVKNLCERYHRMSGKCLLVPFKMFPSPARRKNAPPELPTVPREDWAPGRRIRVPKKGIYWL